MSFHLTVASSMKHPSASAAQSEPLSETPTVCAGAAAAAKLGSLSLPAFTRYAAVSRPMMRRPTGVKSGARKPTPFFWDVKSFATNCLIVLMDAMPAAGIADYKNKKVSWPGRVLSTPKVPCDRWQNIYIREYRLKSGLACPRRTPKPWAPVPDGGRDGYPLAAQRTQYSRCPGAPSGRGPPQHLHLATRFHGFCPLRVVMGGMVSIMGFR